MRAPQSVQRLEVPASPPRITSSFKPRTVFDTTPNQQLRRLDHSSSEFPDQVSSILYGEEYRQWVRNPQSGDLVWFVDYLDEVRRMCRSFAHRSSHHRLSMFSILLVPLSGSAYASSETYAVLE